MQPTRMPRYYVSNDGVGPYAIFYCDRCNREYRSQPSITATVADDVKRGVMGGLLRKVPVVGYSVASNVENERYRNSMTQQELATAWQQVQQYFRECPTCHQVVCIPDFDEVSGYCQEDSPRRQEIAQAQAEQAGAALKGFANAFGITDAIRKAGERAETRAQSQAQVAAMLATCPQCGSKAPAGTRFCHSCGGQMVQPAPPAPQAVAGGVTCANCGASVPAGQKFCGECGAPVPQPTQQTPQETVCPNCGSTTTTAFCGNCGTKVR